VSGPAELSIPEHRRFALNPECISCTNPEDDPSTFAVSQHWKIVLHPDQTVPGAVLVVSLRHAPKLSDLTEAEAADFFRVAAALERSMESALTATMVNFSCLRNWSYRPHDPTPPWRNGAPNPHVHWHVAPRYDHSLTVLEQQFTDPDFGEELHWRSRTISPAIQTELTRRLQKELGLR
jgi:diadenosine tetraphosphate (Ap4A) HIT family hydrolase